MYAVPSTDATSIQKATTTAASITNEDQKIPKISDDYIPSWAKG